MFSVFNMEVGAFNMFSTPVSGTLAYKDRHGCWRPVKSDF